MDVPYDPFVQPDDEEEAQDVLCFLAEVGYTYSSLANETDDLSSKGMTLWAMREFHNFHVWSSDNGYIVFPEEALEDHREGTRTYHDTLCEFFKDDETAVKKFSEDTRERMVTVFESSDP